MKSVSVILLSLLTLIVLSTGAVAADKAAIQKHVDEVVSGIDGGKDAAEYKADAYTPYVFVMEEKGNLIVHPSLAGQSLKEKAAPVYDALVKATPEGVWVDYEWKGSMKHSYVKKTDGDLIVGSGYSD